jgi:hypothetical protein
MIWPYLLHNCWLQFVDQLFNSRQSGAGGGWGGWASGPPQAALASAQVMREMTFTPFWLHAPRLMLTDASHSRRRDSQTDSPLFPAERFIGSDLVFHTRPLLRRFAPVLCQLPLACPSAVRMRNIPMCWQPNLHFHEKGEGCPLSPS